MALFPPREECPTGRPGSEGEFQLNAARAWNLNLAAVKRVTYHSMCNSDRTDQPGFCYSRCACLVRPRHTCQVSWLISLVAQTAVTPCDVTAASLRGRGSAVSQLWRGCNLSVWLASLFRFPQAFCGLASLDLLRFRNYGEDSSESFSLIFDAPSPAVRSKTKLHLQHPVYDAISVFVLCRMITSYRSQSFCVL